MKKRTLITTLIFLALAGTLPGCGSDSPGSAGVGGLTGALMVTPTWKQDPMTITWHKLKQSTNFEMQTCTPESCTDYFKFECESQAPCSALPADPLRARTYSWSFTYKSSSYSENGKTHSSTIYTFVDNLYSPVSGNYIRMRAYLLDGSKGPWFEIR